nr:MAG TPA: hypothetical protein [Caudoviricetes sp.]
MLFFCLLTFGFPRYASLYSPAVSSVFLLLITKLIATRTFKLNCIHN